MPCLLFQGGSLGKPAESDSDDDEPEVSAWDGTIAPGEQPARKLSSLGLNKTLSDLFRTTDGEGPKDGGESDGSAVTTQAQLEHLNAIPSTSSLSTSPSFSYDATHATATDHAPAQRSPSTQARVYYPYHHPVVDTEMLNAEWERKNSACEVSTHTRCDHEIDLLHLHFSLINFHFFPNTGQKMFSEAHANVPTKAPAPSPANALTQRCSQPTMPMHNIQLEHHFQRQQQQRLREQPQRQYSQFGQQQFHPYQTTVQTSAPPYATYPNAFQAFGYPAPGSVPLVNNIMYNPAAGFNTDAYVGS